MSDIMCNECKRCDGDLCTYFDNYSDRESTIACILFEPKKPTLFDRITASPEVLAPKFIYEATTCDGDGHILSGYRSTITAGFWLAKSEAIAATVAKLKEAKK